MTARLAGMREMALPDMERRLANMVRDGVIAAVDLPGKRVRVRSGEILTAWLPWPAGRAGAGKRRWDPPEVGEQVVMISPSGDLRQARVIPGIYQDAYDAPSSDGNLDLTEYGDGTRISYDRGSHTLVADVNAAGTINLRVGGTTLVLQDGRATLTVDELNVVSPTSKFSGNVEIAGGISVAGGGSGGTSTISGVFNITGGGLTHNGKDIGSTHTHSGVETGGGTTGEPT